MAATAGALSGCFTASGTSQGSGAPGSSGVDAGGPGPGAIAGDSGVGGSVARDGAGSDGPGAIPIDGAIDIDSAAGPFVLSWEDDFNTLDPSAWQLQTFTYGGNEAQFSTQNATVSNGILTISLTPNPGDTAEPYLGVEMRSAKTLTYGRVSASMRFAPGSGVVSGLVLFYTPFPNCNWNEIDIEHLGDSAGTSQLNSQVFTGTPVPQCTTSVSPTADPLIVNLGVNAETEFHQYDIEWTPAGVTTFVDGTSLRTWTQYASLMNLPQTVLFTIWASSAASWAGALGPSSAPTSAEVDWIKVYDWQP
jgi:endo-1,3-1,4-beta-glycanase ExoK